MFGAFGNGDASMDGPGVLRREAVGGLANVSGKSFQFAPFAFGGGGGPEGVAAPARGGGTRAADCSVW